jgi:hypothetical protein
LVTVTRVRNEADIVEAFVRHHLAFADHAVLLDDGSNDRTGEIMYALRAEGLPLTLLRARSAAFIETVHNTALLRRAALLGADWVLCLDCDEFVDTLAMAAPLRDALADLPAQTLAVQVELVNYYATADDDPAELVVPRRQRHRAPAPSRVFKVFVRGGLARLGGEIAPGNHAAQLHGEKLPAASLPGLALAHFPARNGWQLLAKAVVGRLKVLAAAPADVEPGTSGHYTKLLANLQDHPEWLLFDREFLDGKRPPQFVTGGAVAAPMAYRGGALRYTQPVDPCVHAAQSVMAFAELLAERHGRLLDLHPAAHAATRNWDGELFEV